MKKKLFPFFLLGMYITSLQAQYPDLSKYIVDFDAGPSVFDYPCDWTDTWSGCNSNRDRMNTEIPPWIIGGGGEWRSYFITDGGDSYVVSIPKSIIANYSLNIKDDGTGPNRTSSAQGGCAEAIYVEPDLVLNTPATQRYAKGTNSISMEEGFEVNGQNGDFTAAIVNGLLAGQDWRRSYYNIYTAQYLVHPVEGPVTIGFIDAENKAHCSEFLGVKNYCPATVNPYNPAYDATGVFDYSQCPLGDYWPTMAGFVCARWIPNNASTNWGQVYFDNDMGPITWPSNGYMSPSGQKVSNGVGIPSSITWDGYVYVFYHDNGPQQLPGDPPVAIEDGRHEGIKVVRAPVSEALNPAAYKAYYKDPAGVEHWNPSLPTGFDKDNMDLFWDAKGPLSTDLMGDQGQGYSGNFLSHRFAVAHVANSNPAYFIGVEVYVENGNPYVALRFSSDLVNWTERKRIIEAATWSTIKFNYAIFVDFDGWSNTEIDVNNFFLLGKANQESYDNAVNKVHIYAPGFRKAVNTTQTNKQETSVASSVLKVNENVTGVAPTPNQGHFRMMYTLTGNARVQINVLDMTGRQIYTVTPGAKAAGHYTQDIDISAHTNGVYMIELMIDGCKRVYKTVKQ